MESISDNIGEGGGATGTCTPTNFPKKKHRSRVQTPYRTPADAGHEKGGEGEKIEFDDPFFQRSAAPKEGVKRRVVGRLFVK